MRVPTYEPGQVRLQPRPNVRLESGVSPEGFGTDLAQAGQRVGAQLAAIGADARARADAAVVMDAASQFDAVSLDVLNNPKTGAFTARGRDAVGIADSAGAELDRRRLELRGGLRSEPAKLAFDRATVPQFMAHQRALMEHEDREGTRAGVESASARIKSQQEIAAANFGDPAVVASAVETMTEAAHTLARLRGDDPETAGAAFASDLSSLHRGVAAAFLAAGQAEAASAYVEAHRDDLLEADEAALRSRIAPMADQERAYALSDGIWDRSGGSLDRAMALTRAELGSSPLRQDVEAILDHRASQQAEQERDTDQSNFRDAYSAFSARRTTADIPPALLASLAPDRQEWFRDQMRQDAIARQQSATLTAQERAAKREAEKSQSTGLWGRIVYGAREDPEGFRNLDLVGDPGLAGLTDEDRKDLIRRQDDYRKAFEAGSVDLPTEGDESSILVSTAVTAKILKSGASGPDQDADQEFVRFRDSFRRWVAAYRRQSGKEPSVVEMQAEANRLATSVKIGSRPGFWSMGWPVDVTRTAGELTPEERLAVRVSPEDAARITARLRAAGAPTDEATVRAAYLYELGIVP